VEGTLLLTEGALTEIEENATEASPGMPEFN
jgi:hypothetical protein